MSTTRDSLLMAQKLAAQVSGQICLIVERGRELTPDKISTWAETLREAAQVLDRVGGRS